MDIPCPRANTCALRAHERAALIRSRTRCGWHCAQSAQHSQRVFVLHVRLASLKMCSDAPHRGQENSVPRVVRAMNKTKGLWAKPTPFVRANPGRIFPPLGAKRPEDDHDHVVVGGPPPSLVIIIADDDHGDLYSIMIMIIIFNIFFIQ